jgi:hypothetical protein
MSGKAWTAPAVASQSLTVTQPQLPLRTASQNARLLKQRLQTLIRSSTVMPFEKKKWKAILDQLNADKLAELEITAKLDESLAYLQVQ